MLPAAYRPTSVKRPHWVLLGFDKQLRAPGATSHTVLGKKVVTYRGVKDELLVVEEACPHRGASLATGTVRDSCLTCSFHGLDIGVHTHPHLFYEYAALQGFVWLDAAKDLITQHFMPPYFPDLTTAKQGCVFSKTIEANALVYMESLLDGPGPLVRMGPDGKTERVVETRAGPMRVEIQYHVPLVVHVRYTLQGKTAEAVVGLLPQSHTRTLAHVHMARTYADPSTSALLLHSLRRDLFGKATAVGSVDAASWGKGTLGPRDALVAEYRDAMRRLYPDMLAYLTHAA